MPSLLRPRVWTSQPQYPVGIDWSNSFAYGLIGVINAAAFNATQVGTIARSQNSTGATLNGNGSSLVWVPTVALGSAATILMVGNQKFDGSGVTSPGAANGIGNTAGGNQLFTFQGAATLGATKMRALIRTVNAGGITTAESTSAGVGEGDWAVWVSVYDGTTALKLYKNGTDDTFGNANVAASGSISTLSGLGLGGIHRGTDSFGMTGQNQALSMAWNRALTLPEVRAISANPWQIFAPQVT